MNANTLLIESFDRQLSLEEQTYLDQALARDPALKQNKRSFCRFGRLGTASGLTKNRFRGCRDASGEQIVFGGYRLSNGKVISEDGRRFNSGSDIVPLFDLL